MVVYVPIMGLVCNLGFLLAGSATVLRSIKGLVLVYMCHHG